MLSNLTTANTGNTGNTGDPANPVQELCRRCSFEQVAYLRWHGRLPTPDQLRAQQRAERGARALAPALTAQLNDRAAGYPGGSPPDGPLDDIRAAVSLIGAAGPAPGDSSPDGTQATAVRLFALLPAVIAAGQRRRRGLDPVAPRPDLGYAANFLYMTFGKVPEPQIVRAFEVSLILYAEHSVNTTPPARVADSTAADLYGAVAAVAGSLPASATEAVIDMMNEIGVPGNARPWLDAALASGRKIPGFGHRLERSGDPRVPAMRPALGMIAALRGGQRLTGVYEALAEAVNEARGLLPHLDYAAAPAYHLIGLDTAAFTPVLFAARLPGLTAHLAGQLARQRAAQLAPLAQSA
jgi:citrate synthase